LGIRLANSAKYLACSLEVEGPFVNLTIALDCVHRFSFVVGEGCDSLGALIPVHCNSATVESFNKDDGLVGGHKESIGECLVVKCLAPLIKMADPLFVKQSIRSSAPNIRGVSAKTIGAAPADGAVVAPGAAAVKATTCACSIPVRA
jgi:hypothetical protein